jgi:hypothetical protein
MKSILAPLAILLIAACSSGPRIHNATVVASEPAAMRLLQEAREAHGGKAIERVRDISVRYEGKWGSIGPRFQPELVDKQFRRDSEERLIISPRVIAQRHSGPSGGKQVLREGSLTRVSYNGVADSTDLTRQAAALVADAYQLFLLGPFYFDRPGVVLQVAKQSSVDGQMCDELLAVLKPGIGDSSEDRVLLSIDRNTKQLRRLRMTLNGLDSTQGAEVDVTFREHRTVGGILWPTDFEERIRVPFDLHAHSWKLRGMDLNRGLTRDDLSGQMWTEKASRPASRLP